MERLAGCLSLKADRQVFTPLLEAAAPHINHREHVILTATQSPLVQWKYWGQAIFTDGQRAEIY